MDSVLFRRHGFDWRPFHGHLFLLIWMHSVFKYYSSPAYDSRYLSLLQAVSLAEICACSFLQVLYAANRGVTSIFGKSASFHCIQPALLSFSPALLDVSRHSFPLTIACEPEYDAAQNLVAFSHLESSH